MIRTNPYDLAIVGGGLGGLCLAVQLAQQGRKVVVIEKESYPFHRVCGEYISLESWSFLERLGLDFSALNLPLVTKLIVTNAAGRPHRFSLPLGGFGISRFLLDHLLVQKARQSGVEVLESRTVTGVQGKVGDFVVSTKEGSLGAKLVAGAWGKRSHMDKQWNRPFMLEANRRLSDWVGVKYHIRYNHPADEIVLHNFRNGYCGMSRIEEGKSCLCYLVKSSELKRFGSIAALEAELLSTNPALAQILKNADRLYAQPLVISNVSFERKTQVENGVLLLGDAAGLITPLCGNGMSMAMHASKLAADSLTTYLDGRSSWADAEADYERFWQKEFGGRLQVGRWVQAAFGNSTTTTLLLKTLKALPVLASGLIRQTHGKPF